MSDESIRSENLERAWDILSENREVRYFAKRSDGAALGGRLHSPKALIRAARNLESLGYDIYLHLNPSVGPGLKATSRQVTALRHILIDLDPTEPELDATTAIQSVLGIADELHPGTSLAAHVLDTGRGAQAWVSVGRNHTDVPLSMLERATAQYLTGLRRAWDGRFGFRIDSVCYDLGRIARCPGTLNTKTGNRAKLISTSQVALTVEPFFTKFYTSAPKQANVRPANVSNLMALSPHLNGLAREFLHNGVEEGDRHHAAYVAARNCLELGVGLDSIRYWLLRGAGRCRPRLSKRDTLHCIETALRKGKDAEPVWPDVHAHRDPSIGYVHMDNLGSDSVLTEMGAAHMGGGSGLGVSSLPSQLCNQQQNSDGETNC